MRKTSLSTWALAVTIVLLLVVGSVTYTWLLREGQRNDAFKGCMIDTAGRVDGARKNAIDSQREALLARHEPSRAKRHAHQRSANAALELAVASLGRAGIHDYDDAAQRAYLRGLVVGRIARLGAEDPDVQIHRSAFCNRVFPPAGLLG